VFGVELSGPVTGTVILNCYIGTNATGNAGVPNVYDGICIQGAVNTRVGFPGDAGRNVISGNNVDGVSIVAATATLLENNFIGVAVDGKTQLANQSQGVELLAADRTTIGMVGTTVSNVISGNGLCGIIINDPATSGTVVVNNFIGTDKDGQTRVGNGQTGVAVGGGSGTTIGGSGAGGVNVISGNGSQGISVFGATGTIVRDNIIGLTADRTASLGNGGDGIWVQSGADGTRIGGPLAGDSNMISANQGFGVVLDSNNCIVQGNTIGFQLDNKGQLAKAPNVAGSRLDRGLNNDWINNVYNDL
jgi:hypothetical protein